MFLTILGESQWRVETFSGESRYDGVRGGTGYNGGASGQDPESHDFSAPISQQMNMRKIIGMALV